MVSSMSLSQDDRVQLRTLSRRLFLDELLLLGDIAGRMDLFDFLTLTWDLESMPSTDSRFKTATGDIWQHMVNNDDWSYPYLFGPYLGLIDGSDEQLLHFLEHVVHPSVRTPEDQPKYLAVINQYLAKEGYELRLREEIAGFHIYRATRIGAGVSEKVKNIVFASNGPKPRIVLADAVSNDIAIVENEEHCLVYDIPLPQTGLRWSDLVAWWAERCGAQPSIDTE
jgi:AbiJ-like protein